MNEVGGPVEVSAGPGDQVGDHGGGDLDGVGGDPGDQVDDGAVVGGGPGDDVDHGGEVGAGSGDDVDHGGVGGNPEDPVGNHVGEDQGLVGGDPEDPEDQVENHVEEDHDEVEGGPGDQVDDGGVGGGPGDDVDHSLEVEGDPGDQVGNHGEVGGGSGDDVDHGAEVGAGPGDQVGNHAEDLNDSGCAGDAPAPSSNKSQETLESLSEDHGPLANAHMPTSSVLIKGSKKTSSEVTSLHPWRLDLFDPKNTVRFSVSDDDYQRIVSRRRNVVSRNYRSGRMYAILEDGQIAMSPNEDIKVFLDAQNRERGSSTTVAEWLDLVKASVVRYKALQEFKASKASCGTKRKHERTILRGKSAKTAKAAANETAKRTAKGTTNPFDIDDASDGETEEEMSPRRFV